MNYFPEPYQAHATEHVLRYRGAGLFMEMGLGKTVVTLTAVSRLLEKRQVSKVLVVAPLAVARDVWTDETGKWDHLNHLKLSRVLGTADQRKRALQARADIYVINVENLAWLVKFYGVAGWPFDMIILDELSLFKNASTKRFKAVRTVRPKARRLVGLTGTPRPNGLLDLWSQLYLLDGGRRLGKTLTSYREKYFLPDKFSGHVVYSYKLKEEPKESLLGERIYEREIHDKIGDICVSMTAEDYGKLPDKIVRCRDVSLGEEVGKQYRELERELFLELGDAEVTVANAAVLSGKLLQFSGGALYDDTGAWHQVHETKLEALAEIVETAAGAPVLVFYNYRHELERILARIPGAKLLKESADLEAWNQGLVDVGVAHPKSVGHGTNLQAGGYIIVWFGPITSRELYDQANARLLRRGQTAPAVIIHHIMAKGTLDYAVLASLTVKGEGQRRLMEEVKARFEYYKKTQ